MASDLTVALAPRLGAVRTSPRSSGEILCVAPIKHVEQSPAWCHSAHGAGGKIDFAGADGAEEPNASQSHDDSGLGRGQTAKGRGRMSSGCHGRSLVRLMRPRASLGHSLVPDGKCHELGSRLAPPVTSPDARHPFPPSFVFPPLRRHCQPFAKGRGSGPDIDR